MMNIWSLFSLTAFTLAVPIDSEKRCCPLKVIDNLDLTNYNKLFTPFKYGNFVANDGTITVSDVGLNITSDPFTLYYLPGPVPELDHYKSVWLSKATYKACNKYALEFEFRQASVNVNVGNPPFPKDVSQENDYRFANGLFSIYSAETGFVFGFLVTNDVIYGYYDRLPFQRVKLGNYFAATYVFPLLYPVDRNQPNDLRIVVNKKEATVTYWIDDILLAISDTIGLPWQQSFIVGDMSGKPAPIFPEVFQIQFGTYTLLDMYPACKDLNRCKYPCKLRALVNSASPAAPSRFSPKCGPPVPVVYYDAAGTNPDMHVWGQGVTLNVEEIVVSARKNCTKPSPAPCA